MRNRVLTAAAGVALAAVIAVGLAAQNPQNPSSRAPSALPATIQGKPNLTGLWQTIGTAHWDIQDHSPRPGPFYQLGAVGAIPGGRGIVVGNEIPYKPESAAKKKENMANWLTQDPEVKCYMPGIPRATYLPFPFQIVQSQQDIVMAYEFATANRVINMGKPRAAAVDTWMGTSNGHWDGQTLVVDVVGQIEDSWFDRSGNFHSDALHVTERFTMRNHDVIDYEATIDDPKVFTKSWTIRLPLYRRLDESAQIGEFKCVEYAEELLYGTLRKQTK